MTYSLNNSYGMREAFYYYRRQGGMLEEVKFREVISKINYLIGEELLKGNDIELPKNMGGLSIRRFHNKVEFVNGKLRTNLPVDWKETKKLWAEDEYCRKHKKLIRFENEYAYTVFYRRKISRCRNKTMIKLYPCRSFKRRLRDRINKGEFEVFNIEYNGNK